LNRALESRGVVESRLAPPVLRGVAELKIDFSGTPAIRSPIFFWLRRAPPARPAREPGSGVAL
jgi:hypothetical protein